MSESNKQRLGASFQRIGSRIESNLKFLKSISKTKSDRKRWKLLANSTADELLSIVEICHNILKSRFILTGKQREKIIPHVDFVRKLSRTRSEKRVRVLIQRGDGIAAAAALPAILTPILAELLREIKNRAG